MSTTRKGQKAAHAARLLDSIGEMRVNGDSCDFKVKVDTNVFYVHRMVLAACSPYFKAMLSHSMKESLEGEVKMKEVSAKAIGTCIQFMYSGEADLTMTEVEGVLHASSFIQLDLLSTVCQNYLEENVTVDSVLYIRDLAQLYGFVNLLTACTTFIQTRLVEVSHTDQFRSLSVDGLAEYIVTLNVDKAPLWISILKWLRYDAENRKDKFPKLLQLFCKNNDDLNTLILSSWKCEEVKESKRCRDIIRDRLIQNINALRACIDTVTCVEMKEILKECDKEEVFELNHEIDMFMIANFDEISTKSGFVSLDYYNLIMLLRAKDLRCSSEKLKWDAIIRWTKHEKRRRKHFPDLLRLLDFDLMAIDFIQSTIRNEALVRESNASMAIVMDVLVLKAQFGVAGDKKAVGSTEVSPGPQIEKTAAEQVGVVKENANRTSAADLLHEFIGHIGRKASEKIITLKQEDPEIKPVNSTDLLSQQLAGADLSQPCDTSYIRKGGLLLESEPKHKSDNKSKCLPPPPPPPVRSCRPHPAHVLPTHQRANLLHHPPPPPPPPSRTPLYQYPHSRDPSPPPPHHRSLHRLPLPRQRKKRTNIQSRVRQSSSPDNVSPFAINSGFSSSSKYPHEDETYENNDFYD